MTIEIRLFWTLE